jgi:MoaA/NifB/PqqE/SkfB family radical SAM enzyme
MKNIPNNFCWRPFTSLHVDKWGNFGPCCHYKSEKIIPGIKFQDLHKNTRNYIKNKTLPVECNRSCVDLENIGVLATDRITYDGPIDINLVKENKFNLLKIELSVDNICNLACVTCNSFHSNRWKAENKRMNIEDSIDIKYLDVNLFKDVAIWKNIQELTLYGGEPFYSKNTVNLINWLMENNLGNNIDLVFYTNGTIVPDNLIEMAAKFKRIYYSVSIDATHERFEILRWPAKWSTVESNFKKLQSLKTENILLDLTYTYSICNASYTADDIDYFYSNFGQDIYIGRNMVTYPAYWMARHLPDKLKEKIIKKYQKNNFLNYFVSELEAERDESLYQEAIKRLKNLDQYRNTDYRILFDEN